MILNITKDMARCICLLSFGENSEWRKVLSTNGMNDRLVDCRIGGIAILVKNEYILLKSFKAGALEFFILDGHTEEVDYLLGSIAEARIEHDSADSAWHLYGDGIPNKYPIPQCQRDIGKTHDVRSWGIIPMSARCA